MLSQMCALNLHLCSSFVASTETIGPSAVYTMAAEVGLLSRNIRIIGADYPKLEQQAFGVRVLVGTFADDDAVHTGMLSRFYTVIY